MTRIASRLAVLALTGAGALALSACGHSIEQKAATGAVAGAVVAGPVGAAVGGAAGAAVGHAQKPH
ncbi:hypothetical protein FM111_05745 [Brevundimonas diminuta 3F5N]|uniref:Lipoprotein n=1 Tax=Brevundimonas diminuta 3F5N TaxID=1255603 RepID=A0A1R4FN76_BREDI|nr:hypothetical protein [Brevundimonas diminuta]SJM57202.1 hypothetical protein FM111_05745 [Brevundimonas diminuta 3F5N]